MLSVFDRALLCVAHGRAELQRITQILKKHNITYLTKTVVPKNSIYMPMHSSGSALFAYNIFVAKRDLQRAQSLLE